MSDEAQTVFQAVIWSLTMSKTGHIEEDSLQNTVFI